MIDPTLLKRLVGSAFVGIVLALLIAAGSFYGIVSATLGRICFMAAWLIGVAGVVFSELLWARKVKEKVFWGICAALLWGVVLFEADDWARKHGPQSTSAVHNQPTQTVPFEVQVEISLQAHKPYFWIVNDEGDFTACPVAVVIGLQLTNLQADSTFLYDYTVEGLDADDNWVKLRHVVLRQGQHVYSGTPTRAQIVKSDFFDELTRQYSFEPHKPVRGWAFFESPPYAYPFFQFRVTVHDVNGTRFTSENLKFTKKYGQMPELKTGTKVLDLTKNRINDYCGR